RAGRGIRIILDFPATRPHSRIRTRLMSVPSTKPLDAGQPERKPGGPVAYFKRHPVGFWFIFWGELAERCAYYGVRALFVLYMVDVLFKDSIPDKDARGEFAQNIAYTFKAACYYLPLVGGIIADRYIGKYWTIVGFAVPYVFGPILLGIPIPWV